MTHLSSITWTRLFDGADQRCGFNEVLRQLAYLRTIRLLRDSVKSGFTLNIKRLSDAIEAKEVMVQSLVITDARSFVQQLKTYVDGYTQSIICPSNFEDCF